MRSLTCILSALCVYGLQNYPLILTTLLLFTSPIKLPRIKKIEKSNLP